MDGMFDELVYFIAQYANFKETWEMQNDTLISKKGPWGNRQYYLILEKSDKTLKLKEIKMLPDSLR